MNWDSIATSLANLVKKIFVYVNWLNPLFETILRHLLVWITL